jgi:hypothetical protein
MMIFYRFGNEWRLVIDEGWPWQCPWMVDLGSGERGALDEFKGYQYDNIMETKLGFTIESLLFLCRLIPSPFIGGWVLESWSGAIQTYNLCRFTIEFSLFELLFRRLLLGP